MNQFFDVANSQGIGCFISAKDKEDAVQVAVALGHVKKASSARVNGPMDMSKDSAYGSVKEILESGKRGQFAKQIQTLNIMDVLAGKKRKPGKWFLMKEVGQESHLRLRGAFMSLLCKMFGHRPPFLRPLIQWRAGNGRFEVRCLRCKCLIQEFKTFSELKEHIQGDTTCQQPVMKI
jgi:hypothetical protein